MAKNAVDDVKGHDAFAPRVSVIVITYNQEATIAQTVESILAQKTDFPFEILIGEDCSPDGTRAVVDRLVKLHPDRIRPIYPSTNVGAQRNFMNCHDRADGEILAFCEGDDFWIDPDKLQRQVDDLDAAPLCDLSFTRGYEVRADGSRTIGWDYGDRARVVPVTELFGHFRWVAPSASLVWRADATSDLKRAVADADFLDLVIILLGAARGGATYRPDPTVGYRVAGAASFTAALEATGRAKQRAFYRKAAGTIMTACAIAGLPRSTIRTRLDDYRLAIARLHWHDRNYVRAVSALFTASPAFLLRGAVKAMRNLHRRYAAPIAAK